VTLPNVITIVGRLTADPQLFLTRSGRPKVTFRLACPRSAGHAAQGADYVTVVCIGDRFRPLMDSLARGKLVTVIGRLVSRDIAGGRTATEVRAQTVLLNVELPVEAE